MSVSRTQAITKEVIELRVSWYLPSGQLFDPYEIRKVVILNPATGAVVQQVGARDIERVSQGVYRVFVGPFSDPVVLADRWVLTPIQGGAEQAKQFRVDVALPAAIAQELVTTREELISDYLYGLDLTDDNGVPYPDSMFETAIRYATAQVEAECDIVVMPTDYLGDDAERHDYGVDYAQYAFLKLDHRPLIEVVSVKAVYPGNAYPIIDFPKPWIQVHDKELGGVNLVPAAGSLAYFVGQQIPIVHFSGAQLFPDLFRVEYRAGFERGKVPANVKQLISLLACFNILNPAGDMLGGAGVASYSLSMGGLSQSISTTSSATNAGYGSRLIQYDKDMKRLYPAIRAKYHGTGLHVV